MKNILSAIIIDPLLDEHDYSNVESQVYNSYAETAFDIRAYKDASSILSKINEFREVDCIITVGNIDSDNWDKMCKLPFLYRKKWVHIDSFDKVIVAESIIAVFLGNISRENSDPVKLFSFFTCAFNTSADKLTRLYNSMLSQTYGEWNWYVLDDSTNEGVTEILKEFNDPRIVVIKNVSNHGSIGFNKHVIAMACDGDYLVEVDHDDELTSDCLSCIKEAFDTFPDTDFVYSDVVEYIGGQSVLYGEGWGVGEGGRKWVTIKGESVLTNDQPMITPFSIRAIYSQPNHVRCWKKNFYHKIGGHNPELGVLDDMDLNIRTFLNGKMTKVDKVLYIQYEGTGERGVNGETTQSQRFAEIQRTNTLLYRKYDKEIHERILELGMKDTAWDENLGYSSIWAEHKRGEQAMNYILKKED